jgi:cobyrinic acid a,c-diamide synthase
LRGFNGDTTLFSECTEYKNNDSSDRELIMQSRILIAGTHSGVGKTTITLGLIGALKAEGLDVQPYKVGPDFIDTYHHAYAAEKASYNLDSFMMTPSQIRASFAVHTNCDISVIEGVMGLYDGMDGKNEEGSSAHIAKILETPVILVIDAKAMSRSAGAVVLGYKSFDPSINLAGVIFNRVGSKGHESMLKEAIESCDIQYLGSVFRKEEMEFKERHLGLVMEKYDLNALVKEIRESIDLDKLIEISHAPEIKREKGGRRRKKYDVEIGIARDKAFCFYYQENIDILNDFANVLTFSPLTDDLPDVDGIYIGGGYPELYEKNLEENEKIRMQIKKRVEDGMPLYAECGGLMYALEEMDGYEMLGLFKGKSKLTKKPQAIGYVEVKVIRDCLTATKGLKLRGHEFHYSETKVEEKDQDFAYKLNRGMGIAFGVDGLIKKNVLASYMHVHAVSHPEVFERFVERCVGT